MTKIKSYSSLPEDYKLDFEVDMLKDEKVFLRINLGSFLLLIPFVLIGILFQFTFEFEMWSALAIVPTMIATVIVHEVIHGIFFKLGTKEKIRYKFHGFAASASVKGVYFTKRHYLLVGLAPAVILNGLFILLCIFVRGPLFFLLYINLAVHFGGCTGDFFIALKLRRFSEDTLIEDTGVGMKFYRKSTSSLSSLS